MAEKTEKKAALTLKVGKSNLIAAVLAFVSLLFLFIDQMSIEGITYFGVFQEDISELSGALGAAKVFAIITLIVCIIKIVLSFVDLEKLVKPLSNFKFGFNRLLSLVYYGLYMLTLIFILIGSLSASSEECVLSYCVKTSVYPRFIWYVMVIFTVFAILCIVLPKFKNKIKSIIAVKVVD